MDDADQLIKQQLLDTNYNCFSFESKGSRNNSSDLTAAQTHDLLRQYRLLGIDRQSQVYTNSNKSNFKNFLDEKRGSIISNSNSIFSQKQSLLNQKKARYQVMEKLQLNEPEYLKPWVAQQQNGVQFKKPLRLKIKNEFQSESFQVREQQDMNQDNLTTNLLDPNIKKRASIQQIANKNLYALIQQSKFKNNLNANQTRFYQNDYHAQSNQASVKELRQSIMTSHTNTNTIADLKSTGGQISKKISLPLPTQYQQFNKYLPEEKEIYQKSLVSLDIFHNKMLNSNYKLRLEGFQQDSSTHKKTQLYEQSFKNLRKIPIVIKDSLPNSNQNSQKKKESSIRKRRQINLAQIIGEPAHTPTTMTTKEYNNLLKDENGLTSGLSHNNFYLIPHQFIPHQIRDLSLSKSNAKLKRKFTPLKPLVINEGHQNITLNLKVSLKIDQQRDNNVLSSVRTRSQISCGKEIIITGPRYDDGQSNISSNKASYAFLPSILHDNRKDSLESLNLEGKINLKKHLKIKRRLEHNQKSKQKSNNRNEGNILHEINLLKITDTNTLNQQSLTKL